MRDQPQGVFFIEVPRTPAVVKHKPKGACALSRLGAFARWATLATCWSPDRSQISFVGTSGNECHVYVVRANDTGLRHLTRGEGYDLEPEWAHW